MATVTLSKGEKRSRKALLALGLVPVEGVYRVTMKRDRGKTYVVDHAEVYKSPDADSYIIFGEGTVMNVPAQQRQVQEQLAQALPAPFEITPELLEFNRAQQQQALFAQEPAALQRALRDTTPHLGHEERLKLFQQANRELSIQELLAHHQQAVPEWVNNDTVMDPQEQEARVIQELDSSEYHADAEHWTPHPLEQHPQYHDLQYDAHRPDETPSVEGLSAVSNSDYEATRAHGLTGHKLPGEPSASHLQHELQYPAYAQKSVVEPAMDTAPDVAAPSNSIDDVPVPAGTPQQEPSHGLTEVSPKEAATATPEPVEPGPPSFPEKDIQQAMSNGKMSRAAAVSALWACNGDVMNAILAFGPY